MLTTPAEAITHSKIYNVPPEDILFLDFSLCGVAVDFTYARVRFEFLPQNKPYFKTSFQRGVTKYFFAPPTNPNSPYRIEDGYLITKEEIIGEVKYLANDTCDSSYPRRGGTVLNLNPISKSQCHGCKFCHTLLQDTKDTDEDLRSESGLKRFVEDWLKRYKISDLANLNQVAIVTGCFESEQKLVEYLKMLKTMLDDYDFNGELFYYGSEITTKEALDDLKEIKPFALCLSLECFENRKVILRDIKKRVSIGDANKILERAVENGFRTNFSYILGIESLEAMKKIFEELFSYINRFPVINIFQIHHGQEKLRYSDAWKMNYYMKARKILEKIFKNTNMRPRPWENYRSLWYLNFDEEGLNDVRTP